MTRMWISAIVVLLIGAVPTTRAEMLEGRFLDALGFKDVWLARGE